MSLVDEAHQMVFSHESKTSGIQTHAFDLPENEVSGLVFDLEGPVASPLQFFASDSTTHFLRGSLYFQHVPNPDSIGPALDYVRARHCSHDRNPAMEMKARTSLDS